MPRKKQPPLTGLIATSLRIPEGIHEDMRVIQSARCESEHGYVRLGRLYREAVEYWLNAGPQREILDRFRALAADTRPDQEVDGVLRAGI